MRTVFLSLAAVALIPWLAEAQGSIIPRTCVPRPCTPERSCPPCLPGGPSVVKQSSEVRADLIDRVLRYEITEVFVNQGAGVGEADYIFPLPRGAAFQDLKLSINGQMVSGETMNASQARAIYEDIVRRQRDPALVEWMGYGMLRARIFPIAPGEEKKVVVRYQMVAEREGDALRVDYYQGKQTGRGVLAFAGGSGEESPRSSFLLTYTMASQYGNAYSPTHSIATTQRAGRREVSVRGSASGITLLVPMRKSAEPAVSVLSYAPRGEDGFVLIALSPPATAPRVTPRDVTLVLDVSGSMSGIKIRQAREAGKQLLATLNSTDRFRLIDFSTDVRSFRDQFVRASAENIAAGTRYLEGLDASGSTNISGALDAALEGESPEGRLGLVLFVTDGAPTVGEKDPDAIAARVQQRRKNRRIFSFGVGADLNAALVERLAVEGRGTAQFVRPEESVERAVSIVASRLTSPVVTNLRVSVDGVRLRKLHPSESADVFAGQDYVLLARYDGSGSTRLRFDGETSAGPVSWTSSAFFPSSSRENSFVARLWATQRVGYLSAEKRRNGGSREVDGEIRELGERYAIPTEFTSYLVVEPGMRQNALAGSASGAAVAGARVRSATVASAPPTQSAKAFEAARDAAQQRAVTNIAAADESERSGMKEGTRRIGSRIFAMRGDSWTDTREPDAIKVVKVKTFSEAYFKLMEAIPELQQIFVLGARVKVTGRSVALETGDNGAESLSDQELRRITSGW